MLISINDEVVDAELWRLCELLELLDTKISPLYLFIKAAADADAEGRSDKAEYFVGIGFVAIQQYLNDTIMFTGLNKKEAYSMGPVHESGPTCATLINSCANWWKHETEWWDQGEVTKRSQKTFDNVSDVTPSPSYQLSNVLYSFCENDDFKLTSIVPYLEKWRDEVHKNRKK